jgi:hypothetical protein
MIESFEPVARAAELDAEAAMRAFAVGNCDFLSLLAVERR